MNERVRASEYMRWAKANHASSRFNLAVSGMPRLLFSDLGASLEELRIEEQDGRGYAPLLSALGAKHGVGADWVVTAEGTSLANHLVLAALLDPGDEVLIEQPGYSPIVDAARYLGADVRRFPRRREDGFAADPAAVARAMTARTRLVVLTNLHNPSGVLIPEATLQAIGEIARSAHAHVLVDEAYLDAVFDDPQPSAIHRGETFVVTSSLTKIYGLSGLRCGYILAPPELARKLWLLKDLFGVNAVHVAERLSVIALGKLPELAARARALLGTNRPVLNRFLQRSPWLESIPSLEGTVAFPRLRRGSVDGLTDLLRSKYETSVVPGRFFDADEHFRVGISCPTAILEEGLARLEAAVGEI